MNRRIPAFMAAFAGLGATLAAFQTPAQGGDTGPFVPVTSLPPGQEIPAAPYLLTAYAVIWLGVMLYAWSIWRRLSKVEQEMHHLEQRRK